MARTDADAADGPSPGEAALREALAEHGEEVAGALDHADRLGEAIDAAVLTVASADDDEVEYVTESIVSLIRAVDGLSTEGAATLAGIVGENGEEAASALETLLRLERDGSLDDLVALAEAASELELDDDAVCGLNRLLGAVGEAERGAEPVGLLGALRSIRTPEGRAGLGYLLEIVRAQGRSLRGR